MTAPAPAAALFVLPTLADLGLTPGIRGHAGYFVRDTGRFYPWFDDDTTPADGVQVIAPIHGSPGRWKLRTDSGGSTLASVKAVRVAAGAQRDLLTIDGYALAEGDRVLDTAQLISVSNGLWLAHEAGAVYAGPIPKGAVQPATVLAQPDAARRIRLTTSQTWTSGADVDVTISGLDEAGNPQTETITIPAPGTTTESVGLWTAIDAGGITWAKPAGWTAGTFSVEDAGAWVRPDDFADGYAAHNAFVFIEQGTTYADSGWECTSDSGADVVGTDALSWTQATAAGQYTASDGVQKIGLDFSADTSVVRTTGVHPFDADQSMGGNQLTDVGAPSAPTDAATKGYIDQLTVASLVALAALDDAPLPNGVIVKVITIDDLCELDTASTRTADGITVINTLSSGGGASPGRWIRRLLPSAKARAIAAWWVDPQNVTGNASDDRDSAAVDATHPLLTPDELWLRRLQDQKVDQATTVDYLSAPSSGQRTAIRADTSSLLAGASIHVRGVRTQVFTGTITNVQAINTATNAYLEIEASGLSDTWTALGGVGRVIRMLTGTNAGAFAVVHKDLGGANKRARLCSMVTQANPLTSTVTEVTPSIGDTFEVVTTTDLYNLAIECPNDNGRVVVSDFTIQSFDETQNPMRANISAVFNRIDWTPIGATSSFGSVNGAAFCVACSFVGLTFGAPGGANLRACRVTGNLIMAAGVQEVVLQNGTIMAGKLFTNSSQGLILGGLGNGCAADSNAGAFCSVDQGGMVLISGKLWGSGIVGTVFDLLAGGSRVVEASGVATPTIATTGAAYATFGGITKARSALPFATGDRFYAISGSTSETFPAGCLVNLTPLTAASGNFTTLRYTRTLVVKGVGGGGGGGGCTSVALAGAGAGGGGSGGYVESVLVVDPSTAYAYVCGAGGAGNSGAAGSDGADSTFTVGATTVTAKGGKGAPVATAATTVTAYEGGAGGPAGTVLLGIAGAGQCGQGGVCLDATQPIVMGGAGGSSVYGGGGKGITTPGNGTAATGYGSGGGGSCTGASAARAGGAGSRGCWIVEEYA